MPTYLQVQRSCDRHNSIERRVHETDTVELRSYWEAACGNNFAITYGLSPTQREQALMAALRAIRSRRRGLIVVISSSDSLERQIRAGIGRNGLGRIWCPTPESGYDLFSGMKPMNIQEILRAICQQRSTPFSVGQMNAFAGAFLALVAGGGTLHLPEMLRWAQRSDEELEWAARRLGLSDQYRNSIRVNTAGGTDMRMILGWLRDAFSGVSTPDCGTNASITTLAGEEALIFLRDRSPAPDVFRLVLMKELETVISGGMPLTLVLDGVEPTQNNYVRELTGFALQHDNVRLGLCGNNLWSMMQPNPEQILGAIRSWVIFSTANQQADEFLARFGSYQYYYPMLSGGNESLFSANYTEAVEQRPRIRTQDLSLYAALLSGHAGEYLELCGRLE